MRIRHRIPSIFNLSMVDVLCCALGCVILLWLVNQEDMTKEPAQQNLPGTTAEYPNWSRKMRWSIEDLHRLPEARDCAEMVKHWILRTDRAATRG